MRDAPMWRMSTNGHALTSRPTVGPQPLHQEPATELENGADASWEAVSNVSRAIPLAGVAAGVLLALAARRSGRVAALGLVGISIAAVVARWQLARAFTPHARYRVERTIDDLEIRVYAPAVFAETIVHNASFSEALNEGFRRLAGYVFGDNIPLSAKGARGIGETIAMTTPVCASLGPATLEGLPQRRTVSFVMPAERAFGKLPLPKDHRVRLRPIPERRLAVLRFRGARDAAVAVRMRDELLAKIDRAGLETFGDVAYAGYDPPTTLPWLRRNEVMVELIPARALRAPYGRLDRGAAE